ncbi:MAG: HAD family hydrolase [Pseudomonadota bacterium]
MGKPLIIFDFDGVIVDTVKFLEAEIRKKLSELGYNFMESRKETLDLFEDNIVVALIEHGLTPEDMCAVWEHIQDVTEKGDIKLCAGIRKMLEELKDKCDMAIVSSNSSTAIRSVLDRLDVCSFFFAVSGGDEALSKTERIKRCMKELGTKPSRTFYVGDTVGDVHEAHEAGVAAIAVQWGMHPEERLKAASPEFIMKDPRTLMNMLSATADEDSTET